MSDDFYFCADIEQKDFPETGSHSYKMSPAEENRIPFNWRHILFEGMEKDCKHYWS